MKKVISVCLILVLLLGLTACGTGTPDSAVSTTDSSSTADSSVADSIDSTPEDTAAAKPTQDRAGNDITLPDVVNSVVVMAPSFYETMVDLGCDDKIIGIDTQTQMYAYDTLNPDWPAFDMMTPDVEQLAALQPDVVLVSTMTMTDGTNPYAALSDLGVCVVCIPSSDSIQGIQDDIAFIAAVMDKTAEGEQIISNMQNEIDRIVEIGATVTDKKSVYFEISAAPYAYSFGSGVFLNEMIELIGATNVFADQTGWLSVETEAAIASDPDVILTSVNYVEDPVAEILSREGWGSVKAVANGEVYYIDNQSSSLPNEHIVTALRQMAEAVYPEMYTAEQAA